MYANLYVGVFRGCGDRRMLIVVDVPRCIAHCAQYRNVFICQNEEGEIGVYVCALGKLHSIVLNSEILLDLMMQIYIQSIAFPNNIHLPIRIANYRRTAHSYCVVVFTYLKYTQLAGHGTFY